MKNPITEFAECPLPLRLPATATAPHLYSTDTTWNVAYLPSATVSPITFHPGVVAGGFEIVVDISTQHDVIGRIYVGMSDFRSVLDFTNIPPAGFCMMAQPPYEVLSNCQPDASEDGLAYTAVIGRVAEPKSLSMVLLALLLLACFAWRRHATRPVRLEG